MARRHETTAPVAAPHASPSSSRSYAAWSASPVRIGADCPLDADEREAVRLDHVARRGVVDGRERREPAQAEALAGVADRERDGGGHRAAAARVRVRPVADLGLVLGQVEQRERADQRRRSRRPRPPSRPRCPCASTSRRS